jgi:hypothetical protein
VQSTLRILPMFAIVGLSGCGLIRRSHDGDASCPPPVISMAQWTPTRDSGVIEGRVLRVESKHDAHPISLPETLVNVEGPVRRTMWGDSSGHFRFSGLPRGTYAVLIRRIGFPARRDTVRVGPAGAFGDIRLSMDAMLPTCCSTSVCM